jgi:putative phosphoesterase
VPEGARDLPKRIGVVSDTHGLLRPQALAFLRGSDFVIHAGDVGDEAILKDLASIAPLIAVRGNNDRAPWARSVRETEVLRVERASIYVIHDIAELDVDPVAAGFHVVVSRHSHKPSITEKGGVLYLNPGSAGRRRFKLPITLATLEITPEGIQPEIHDLEGD